MDKLGIPRTTFYRWYDRYQLFGPDGLEDRDSSPGRVWNRIPDDIRQRVVDFALEEPELSPRELAVKFTDTKGYFVSESSGYRLLKAHDLITSPAFAVINAAGCDQAKVVHRPRLLSDNGSSYIAGDLAKWLDQQNMKHIRGAPYNPQTQGKIERWHQTLKNQILLENYFLPGHLEMQVGTFVGYYNHQRYHESLNNLTPADVYFGRGQTILLEREKIKRRTIETRRLQHRNSAA